MIVDEWDRIDTLSFFTSADIRKVDGADYLIVGGDASLDTPLLCLSPVHGAFREVVLGPPFTAGSEVAACQEAPFTGLMQAANSGKVVLSN